MTLFKLLLLVGLTAVQDVPVEQRDITVKHVVQPGENLYKITRKYLGTDILWQDNWKLNPHITDPNKLKIGDELIIIKERIIPAEKAKVLNVVNRVEKKPSDGDWLSAQDGDEIIQQEGVRTYGKSSALLEFNDESQLKVLEFSQIFLQERATGLTGTDSATIEVIKGDAELKWQPLQNKQTEITIVTGETISRPQANAGQVAELRTGLTQAGNSVISVYQGNSAVASAGSEVQVKQGMGLSVKPGQAPPKPQPLLPAPVLSTKLNEIYNYTNPFLSWEPVSKAAGYQVEICAEAACQSVLKQQSVETETWQVSAFNHIGQFYFRVAAISQDEIVGFRSQPRPIDFSSNKDDLIAPVIAIDFIGHNKKSDEQITIGPETQIQLFAYDEQSQVALLQYRWSDQSDWKTYQDQAINVPETNGTLLVKSVDHLGHESEKVYQLVAE